MKCMKHIKSWAVQVAMCTCVNNYEMYGENTVMDRAYKYSVVIRNTFKLTHGNCCGLVKNLLFLL